VIHAEEAMERRTPPLKGSRPLSAFSSFYRSLVKQSFSFEIPHILLDPSIVLSKRSAPLIKLHQKVWGDSIKDTPKPSKGGNQNMVFCLIFKK
jgi:hypothetical protein